MTWPHARRLTLFFCLIALLAGTLQWRSHRNKRIPIYCIEFQDRRKIVSEKIAITQKVPLKGNLRPILIEKGKRTQEIVYEQITLHDRHAVASRILSQHTLKSPVLTLTIFNRTTGLPEKTYDLLKVRKLNTIATAYYVGDPLVPSDETFLGFKMRRGLVAVDPKVIPLRSRLYVQGYGYGYAADTGSAIKGNRIDLAVKDHEEEKKFMHRPMTVYVLEKAKKW